MEINDYSNYPGIASRMGFIKDDKKIDESFYKIIEIRQLTDETFSLKLPKARFQFKAGQHISLRIHGNHQSRGVLGLQWYKRRIPRGFGEGGGERIFYAQTP